MAFCIWVFMILLIGGSILLGTFAFYVLQNCLFCFDTTEKKFFRCNLTYLSPNMSCWKVAIFNSLYFHNCWNQNFGSTWGCYQEWNNLGMRAMVADSRPRLKLATNITFTTVLVSEVAKESKNILISELVQPHLLARHGSNKAVSLSLKRRLPNSVADTFQIWCANGHGVEFASHLTLATWLALS